MHKSHFERWLGLTKQCYHNVHGMGGCKNVPGNLRHALVEATSGVASDHLVLALFLLIEIDKLEDQSMC
jgi:hypothetical protein